MYNIKLKSLKIKISRYAYSEFFVVQTLLSHFIF